MKLGNYKRIISNDYPEENQKLIEQLGRQLNDGIEQLFAATGGKLTFVDNFLSTVRDVEVTLASANDPLDTTKSTGKPINKTSIALDRSDVVQGVLVISAVNKTNAAVYPLNSPFVSFTQNGTQLFIDNVTGLQANNRYLIRLVALN